MAFDLRGVLPEGYDGEWIRFNMWTWHAIWKTVQQEVPESKEVEYWFVNRGDFVSSELCTKIVDAIEKIAPEHCAKIVSDWGSELTVQSGIGDRALYSALLSEMPAFVRFLKTCNGFYIH